MDEVTYVNEGLGPPAVPYNEQDRTYTGIGARPPQPLSPQASAAQDLALRQRFDEPQVDLVEQAIMARQGFELRKHDLANRLIGANRHQAPAIMAELHNLDQSERYMMQDARDRRMMAHQTMQQNLQLAKQDRETDIDEHGAALMTVLPQLRSAYRNGQIDKETYDNGLLDAMQRYGALGTHHPGVAQLANHYLEEADKLNAFQQRRGISEVTKLAAKYGVDPVVDPNTGEPSVELTRQAALQTDKGRLEAVSNMDKEMYAKYGLGTGVSSLFNPVAPHGSPDNGKTIDIPFIDRKKGSVAKVNIPMPLFNQMKQDFQDRYFAVVPQAQPTQTGATAADPRIALAQRALSDPNATEEHKAAAKRILGLQ